jgi:hypothetical protein
VGVRRHNELHSMRSVPDALAHNVFCRLLRFHGKITYTEMLHTYIKYMSPLSMTHAYFTSNKQTPHITLLEVSIVQNTERYSGAQFWP